MIDTLLHHDGLEVAATASQRLSEAHTSMTASEIKVHSCALAEVIVSQDNLILSLLDQIDQLSSSLHIRENSRNEIIVVLRQIASLYASGRKKAARDFLHQAAAIEFSSTVTPTFDRSIYQSPEVAWPNLFSPKGSL